MTKTKKGLRRKLKLNEEFAEEIAKAIKLRSDKKTKGKGGFFSGIGKKEK